MTDAVPVAAAASKKRKPEAEAAPASKKAKTAPTDEASEESKTIFVGKLSYNVDNDWLKSEFESIGEIVSARVVTDRESGSSRGWACYKPFVALN